MALPSNRTHTGLHNEYALLALVFLTLWTPRAWSEGPGHVNGHVFTNVNAMQKGREVTVSGRVSSGPMKNPLQIALYVSNDGGKTYRTSAVVRYFCGKGELFESKFTAWERARWWKVVAIESN